MFNLKMIGCVAIAISVLNGCAQLPKNKSPQALYDASIADAAVVAPEKVQPLLPLPAQEKINVVSWVTASRVPCDGKTTCQLTTDSNRLWVTLDGEVKNLCKQWKLTADPLRNRLEQLLGLPPNSPPQYQKIKFVTLQVDPKKLQRACLGVNNQDSARPVCTLMPQASTPDELKDYVQQQMVGSYVVHNSAGPGYPFTRLGYTYDWNPSNKTHYGASEFLLMPNSQVDVVDIQSTDDYCR
jgi:uncharacterized protein YceK